MASGGSGVKQDEFANSGTANALQNQYSSNAASVYGGLEPQLASEAAHPTGLTPMQKASQNTAAQQSAGGGTAGAIGAGKLYSARTHNAGGAKAAIGQATRGAGQNLSDAALNTEQQDASLQNKNRQAGLGGLEGLNAEQTSAGEGALGLSDQALGLANEAKPTFLQQFGSQAAFNALKAAQSGATGGGD
jgi:hypothetical protein